MPQREAHVGGPELGRFGKVDVTSDAQRRLIIPALRQIMAVDPHDSMDDRREKVLKFASIAAERIAVPIWGQQLQGVYVPWRVPFSKTKAEEITIRDGRFHHSVLLGDIPHLVDPRITDSLIISDNVSLGIHGGSNPPKFTSEHMSSMAQLGLKLKQNEIRSEDWMQVERSLQEIQGGLVNEYTDYMYGRIEEKDRKIYSKFGELAGTAKIIDKYWMPALRKGASGLYLENSVVYGSSVASYVLGGVIRDSILAVESWTRNFSHMTFDNVYFITKDGDDLYFPPGAKVGNPNAAANAVYLARKLPERPMAAFAARYQS